MISQITVIGVGSGAPAAAVGAAFDGVALVEATPPGAAGSSPLTAARHTGFELDPATIVEEARSHDEAAVLFEGGVLAPLTPRYLARDLAVELGFPVLLAVPATGRLTADALVALEALRGAGLVPAGVVLTDWPDPPPRLLQDERALLTELARVPVLALDGTPLRTEHWRDRVPTAEAIAAERVTLEPYTEWEPRALGDPRATARPEIMSAMLVIIGAEGPMTTSRAYALYNRAAGGRKLTTIARAPLSSAVHWLAQEQRVVLEDDVVRLPDSPRVRVRELGPRTLEEVPLDEIAELVRRLRSGSRRLSDATQAKRAVLNAYGLIRLTTRADEYLGRALERAA